MAITIPEVVEELGIFQKMVDTKLREDILFRDKFEPERPREGMATPSTL